MSSSTLPPTLLARATGYRLHGRVHFLRDCVGEIRPGTDEEFVVFRKVVLDPVETQPDEPGARYKVRFHFARFSAEVNKRLSLIPVPFIVAQSGFRSKTWMIGLETGMFQGVYEWDTVEAAEAYRTSFPLRLMKRRAIPESVSDEIEPI